MNIVVNFYCYVDEMYFWIDWEYLFECVVVMLEVFDVMIFIFRLNKLNFWFCYQFGQFVMFEILVMLELVMCIYMFFFSFLCFYMVVIMVKVQVESIGICWMFDNLKLGMVLKVFGLLGDFFYVCYLGKKYFFVLVGFGIMFMMLMMCDMSDCVLDSDIIFFNCVCLFDDIIFCWELEVKVCEMLYLIFGFIVEQVLCG